MPAKTPEHIVEAAVALYAGGQTSHEAGLAFGISASIVLKGAKERGLIRTISEAKKLAHKRNPPPLPQIDHNKIYRSSDDTHKKCAACEQLLPATTDYFYRRKRDNGRTYFSSSCKPCITAERAEYRRLNPDKAKEANKKSWLRNGHKYSKQKALSLLFCPETKEKRQEAHRSWLDKNKDHMIIYRQARYAEYKDEIKERNRRWVDNNQSKVRAYRTNRKARAKNAEGSFSHDDVARLIESQNGTCYWCKKELDDYHVDHFVPLKCGGSNWPSNLVVACPTCNMSRGTKPAEEFKKYLATITDNADQIEERRAYMREAMRKHRAKKKANASA